MICQRFIGRPIADIGFERLAGSASGLFYPNSMRAVDGPVVPNREAAGQPNTRSDLAGCVRNSFSLNCY
jgi:hypothetical protein